MRRISRLATQENNSSLTKRCKGGYEYAEREEKFIDLRYISAALFSFTTLYHPILPWIALVVALLTRMLQYIQSGVSCTD